MLTEEEETLQAVGVWPGKVIDHEDPEKRGRLRIRVSQWHGKEADDDRIKDEDLPWAEPRIVSGLGTGFYFIPDKDAGVLVAFWGGDPEHPVWLGGYPGDGDVPALFSDSYGDGPRTALLLTPGGNMLELRWVPGERRTRLTTPQGCEVSLYDDDQGPRVTVATPLQKVELSDPQQKVTVETPGQVETTAGATVNTTSGAGITSQAAGAMTDQADSYGGSFAKAVTLVAGLAMVLSAGAALSLTAVGALTLSAAAAGMTFVGLAVFGTVATAKYLVNENIITALNALITAYNAHTGHSTGGSPPAVPLIVSGGTPPFDRDDMVTTQIKAD